MSELAKVLPDIIRLTEEAARANSEASQRLRRVLEEQEGERPTVNVLARFIEPGDEVLQNGKWLRVLESRRCGPRCDEWLLRFAGTDHHVFPTTSFTIRRSCPPECEGDTHRWPCAEAEAICEGLEWERGA